MKVAILGASSNSERPSHKAQALLMEKGHEVIPISVTGLDILDIPSQTSISQCKPSEVHTVTVYLSPQHQSAVLNDLIDAQPKRVIFNPGTENEVAKAKLEAAAIKTEEACTLVLLEQNKF